MRNNFLRSSQIVEVGEGSRVWKNNNFFFALMFSRSICLWWDHRLLMLFFSLHLTRKEISHLNFPILSHFSAYSALQEIFDFCEPINRQHHVRHVQCSIKSTIISWKAFKWMRCIAGQSLTRPNQSDKIERRVHLEHRENVAQKAGELSTESRAQNVFYIFLCYLQSSCNYRIHVQMEHKVNS